MTSHRISLAVNAKNEVQAMKKIDGHGLNISDSLPLKDIDKQAGLVILEPMMEESLLTDEFYKSIRKDKDIVVIRDDLSIKRSRDILKSTHRVETQLKRLMMYVLPDLSKVIGDMLGQPNKDKSKIEWSQDIQDLSFGKVVSYLEIDVSALLRRQIGNGEGLLSLIQTSSSYDELRAGITNLLTPKTVWSSIEPLLVNSCELSFIKSQLGTMKKLRDKAAHPQTILKSEVSDVKNAERHVMRYIGEIKSSFRQDLQQSMKTLVDSIKPIIESLSANIPNFQQEIIKAYTPMIDAFKTVIVPQSIIDASAIASAIPKIDWPSVMPKMDGYAEMMKSLELKDSKNLFDEYLNQIPSIEKELQAGLKERNKQKEINNEKKADNDNSSN